MSNGSLGLNCFRSTLNAATRGLSRSYVHKFASSSARCLSTWQTPLVQTHSRATNTIHHIPYRLPRSFPCQQPPSRPLGVRPFNFLPGQSSVIKDYVDLPPNYSDEEGLPFRRELLDDKEAAQIFGKSLSAWQANHLLMVLHGRRVAGSLEDPEIMGNKVLLPFTSSQKRLALSWLRANVPVDEVVNAGLRAEDELAMLEEEQFGPPAEEGQEDGQKKKEDLGYTSRFKMYKDQEQSKDVHGTGVFDKIRAQNKAKWEELKRKQEEEKRKKEEEAAAGISGVPEAYDPNKPRQPSPWMLEKLQEATSDLKEPPKMSNWERLLPSTIFTLIVVAGFVAYAEYYRPPAPHQRIYRDMPASVATISVLIALNVAGFLIWKVPPLWKLLNRYFIVVAATPRPLALLGGMFSHQARGHLAWNMIGLALIGVQLHEEVGRGDFLATFFSTGLIGGLGSLAALVLRGRLDMTSLGVSSAWYGTTAAWLWMHRFDGFKILGFPPDPAGGVQGLGWLGLMAGVNIAMLFSKSGHRVDVAGHLVGLAAGLVAGHFLELKQERKKKAMEEAEARGEVVEKHELPAWTGLGLFGYILSSFFRPEVEKDDDLFE